MSEESATVNTIMEFERETSRLFQAGDVDRMMEYMADDVKLLNPGSDLLVGSEHERAALFEASQMEGLDMSFEPTGGEISACGDMAYVYGEISIKLPDGSEQFEKYVTIWRNRDGKWQVVLQARNSNS